MKSGRGFLGEGTLRRWKRKAHFRTREKDNVAGRA